MDQQPSPDTQAQPIAALNVPVQSDPRTKDIEENKDLAALSYVWILSVFILVYRRDSAFIRFHARQGAVLFVLSLLFLMLPSPFGRVLMLLVLAGCTAGFVSAAQGMWREIPIVYAISKGDPRLLRSSWKSVVQGIAGLWHRVRNHTGQKKGNKTESGVNQPPPHSPNV